MAKRAWHVQGIDTEGKYRNYVLPTRARARDRKTVLKAVGCRQTAIYRLTPEGRKKVY